MSTTPEVTITATAHTACHACEMSAEGARSYVANGGRITNGKAGNGLRDGGPHWATFTTESAPALAEPAWVDATEAQTEDGALPKVSAVVNPTSKPEAVFEDVVVPTPRVVDHGYEVRAALLSAIEVALGVQGLDAGDDVGEFEEPVVQNADVLVDRLPGRLFEALEVLRDGLEGPWAALGVDRGAGNDLSSARGHDASPSAGECAEPGLASTVSVEGEPAAGGRNSWTPAAAPAGEHGRVINPAALRSIRELAGVRSGALARAAGISHSFLSNIEAGRKQPSPAVARQLARRLGVPLDAITQTS